MLPSRAAAVPAIAALCSHARRGIGSLRRAGRSRAGARHGGRARAQRSRSAAPPSPTSLWAMNSLRRRRRASRRADPEAAARVPVGSRAGRALDRPAHGRRGLRAGAGRATTATTPSCSTSSATCSSRSTSSRCCSRSAGRGRWPRSPTTCTPSSCAGTRTSSARSRSTARARCSRTGTRSRRARTGASRGSSATCRRTCPGRCTRSRRSGARPSTGFDFDHVPYEGVRDELDELEAAKTREERLPRGRRRAVRGGQRRAQAQGRPGARAAGLGRALPRPRRGRRAARGGQRRTSGTSSTPTLRWATTREPGSAWASRVSWPADYEPDRIGPRTPDP